MYTYSTRTYCIILDLLYVEDSVFVLYIYHLTKQSQLERIVYFLSYILIIPIISKQTPCLYISEENMCSFYLQICFFRGKNLISVLSHTICRSVFEREQNLISVLSLILFAWHFFRIVFRSFCSSSFYLQLYIFMKFFPLHFLSVIRLAIIFFYKVFPPFSYHFLLHSFKDRLPKDILWTQSLKKS